MMVTFISQCEKKALNRTRRVLDSFANRIGDNTWQTIITQEGLNAVRKLLRKTATKNTAVSCHWIRSRKRSQLVWVVGNKNKFNEQGVVPVNSTTIQRTYRDDLDDWHYLSLIQSLACLSALLHDWGKANARFQEKLDKTYRGKQGDALRHEWVSCLLLKALIEGTDTSSDGGWLNLLAKGEVDENQIIKADLRQLAKPLSGLPPTAKLIAWLIVTHHRMPLQRLSKKKLLNTWRGIRAETLDELFNHIDNEWGYWNESARETFESCLRFPDGLLLNSGPWIKQLKRWAKKLLDQQSLISQIINDGSYRPILHHARLCLMLGDHYYSSLTQKESGVWNDKTSLIANTQKDGSPKQYLDQHLVGVYEQAKRNVRKLPQLEKELTATDNIGTLKKKSHGDFVWQDKAASKVKTWASHHKNQKHGFFAVNMASTGCGKTFANAKIMLALSEDQGRLRYILALGLRTLTLQTGDEYRERIFQNSDGSDLAVLIGSKAIAELHEQAKMRREEKITREKGSASQESLLEETDEIIYDVDLPEDGMKTILPDTKSRKFLYAPILACTIDHIMAATETTRGGRYILPCLRLMSSDLVIDEVDDFTDSDAIAIGRLIHLAGMLGRKVMISSATIPPALAEGYFNCYREGWQLFAKTRTASTTIGCAWIDEFNTIAEDINSTHHDQAVKEYKKAHNDFVDKRVKALNKQPAKRKAEIIDCQPVILKQAADETRKQKAWFDAIARAALAKHQAHHQVDNQTGIKVSFGVIRIANINPCIELTLHLLDYACPDNTALRVMAYHSQQVLLLRHEQEKHLDTVLKRKEQEGEEPYAFKNFIIRQHLDALARKSPSPENVLFILVATPVEEVGRDHDFDWAIVEPSSYRSIIQLAGRVKRHRAGAVKNPNIGLLQYNWKTLKSGDKAYARHFYRPGYEFKGEIEFNGKTRSASCQTHDLRKLVNETIIEKRLDATPRISTDPPDGFGLARLEHAVTAHWLTRYNAKGPESLQGYLTQHWYLTALPQALNRFRSSEENIQLYRYPDNENTPFFLQKDKKGRVITDDVYREPLNMAEEYNIQSFALTNAQQERLWLNRNYLQLLQTKTEIMDSSLPGATLRYGELLIRDPYQNEIPTYKYNDQLGLFKE